MKNDFQKSVIFKIFLLLIIFLFLFVLSVIWEFYFEYKIKYAVSDGINFLREEQLSYGEFKTYVCGDLKLTKCRFDSTPFMTGVIIDALSDFDDSFVSEIKNKALDFITSQQHNGGFFSYWSKRNSAYNPDKPLFDLDTTSVSSYVLLDNGIDFADLSIDEILKYQNNETGGFYTWITEGHNEFKNNDIDCGVNANLLLYFSKIGVVNDGVCGYLNGVVKNGRISDCSWWYRPNPYAVIYFFSKNLSGNLDLSCLFESKEKLLNYLINNQREDGSWGGPLSTAMSAVSLINLGYNGDRLDSAIKKILSAQNRDGGWDKEVFYIGPSDTTKLFYYSRAVSTAASIEALLKYKNTLKFSR